MAETCVLWVPYRLPIIDVYNTKSCIENQILIKSSPPIGTAAPEDKEIYSSTGKDCPPS